MGVMFPKRVYFALYNVNHGGVGCGVWGVGVGYCILQYKSQILLPRTFSPYSNPV